MNGIAYPTPLIDLISLFWVHPVTFELKTPWHPDTPSIRVCKEITKTAERLHFYGFEEGLERLEIDRHVDDRYRDAYHVIESVRSWPTTDHEVWEAFKTWFLDAFDKSTPSLKL